MKIIFHIDESESWQMTLNNVTNTLNYLKEREQVFNLEVLANGVAVRELKEDWARKTGFYERFNFLAENKVDFVACRNALNASKIEEGDLCSFVRVVPAGIIELVLKQKEGFAYIKP